MDIFLGILVYILVVIFCLMGFYSLLTYTEPTDYIELREAWDDTVNIDRRTDKAGIKMDFTLKQIEALIKQADKPTGIDFLDNRYDWYANLVNHPNPYYRLFYLIAKEFKPDFVVELGSYRATAAAHFALGNSAGQVVTIDMHKDPQQVNDKLACIATAEAVDNLDYINKCTVDNLPGFECAIDDIKAYNKPIDILFIDAWHDEKYVKREQELYFPLLNNPALVICDDLFDAGGEFPGMQAWYASLQGDKFLNNEMHPGIPMGFLKYETKPVTKPRPTRKKRTATRRTK